MFKTKYEFLAGLEKELGRVGVADKSEILADFELHFADSKAQNLSEAEICAKLGSISEIAKQYAEEEIYPVVAVEAPPVGGDDSVAPKDGRTESSDPTSHDQAYAEYENSGIKINFCKFKQGGNINLSGLLTCILIDVFVFSWAITALFGIMVAFVATPFALAVSGFVTMIGGALGTAFFGFTSTFPGIVTFFAGLLLVSLGGLFALLGVMFVKLFVKVVKGVIDWHGSMIFGKQVFNCADAAQQKAEEVGA
jgi:uncharacterized membrane protein